MTSTEVQYRFRVNVRLVWMASYLALDFLLLQYNLLRVTAFRWHGHARWFMISCRDELAMCNMGHDAPTCRTALGRVIDIIGKCRKVEAPVDLKE